MNGEPRRSGQLIRIPPRDPGQFTVAYLVGMGFNALLAMVSWLASVVVSAVIGISVLLLIAADWSAQNHAYSLRLDSLLSVWEESQNDIDKTRAAWVMSYDERIDKLVLASPSMDSANKERIHSSLRAEHDRVLSCPSRDFADLVAELYQIRENWRLNKIRPSYEDYGILGLDLEFEEAVAEPEAVPAEDSPIREETER